MRIHILGICGTFMAGIAILAKQQGHQVSGCDANVYPPMSTQLQAQGIELKEGYHVEHLNPAPDIIIVGNTVKRGNAAMEYVLAEGLPYISGPQWLAENILAKRHVLAVAGTHGKTTTSSLVAWILTACGLQPGFLIGGIPENFGVSAQLGQAPYFVIEADEYDTAFFDKRSKFVHYRGRTVILNNLEFDHADIFSDLKAIKTQFHHLVRTIPNNGLIVCHENDLALQEVLQMGCWTPTTYFGATEKAEWQARDVAADGSEFNVYYRGEKQGVMRWKLLGLHNVYNALAAIAAAQHVGVKPSEAIAALENFQGIKRRLQIRDVINHITVYDDFAHHPTAITTTLKGLRERVGKQRILAIVELGSYTMRTGVHRDTLPPALQNADQVFLALPKGEDWGVAELAKRLTQPAGSYATVEQIIEAVVQVARPQDHILIMSNTGFDGIHEKLLVALRGRDRNRG